jgi:hypothetical protein
MRSFTTRALALFMAVGLVAAVEAHNPEGVQYFAFQFEDDAVPTIDGNSDDWSFIPPFYIIDRTKWFAPNRFSEAGGELNMGGDDFLNFDPWAIYGWNESTNRMYVFVEVIDDYKGISRTSRGSHMWTDDSLAIRWNADHKPKAEHLGMGAVGSNYVATAWAIPPDSDETFFQGRPMYDHNWPGQGIMDFGWTFEGALGAGISTTRYELSTEVTVSVGETLADTELWDLEEGEVIHGSLHHIDNDNIGEGGVDMFWSISPGPDNNPEVDFVLAEIDDTVVQTAVASTSWGMIKAGLAK